MLVILRKLYQILSVQDRKLAVRVLALMMATAVLELLGVGSMLPFLSVIANPDIIQTNAFLGWLYNAFSFSSTENFIIFFALGILGLIISSSAVLVYSLWKQLQFAYGAGHSLSTRLAENYLKKPYSYFLANNTAELNKKVLHDTDVFISGILRPAVTLISGGAIVVAILTILVLLQPIITLVAVATIGTVVALLYLTIRTKLKVIGKSSVLENKIRFQTSAEAFGGVKEVKILGREDYFTDKYKWSSSKSTNYRILNQFYSQFPRHLLYAIIFSALIGSFLLYHAAGQSIESMIPVVGLFAFAAVRLLSPFQQLINALAQFRFNEYLLDKLHDDLLESQDLPGLEDAAEGAIEFQYAIRLDNVRFRYEGTHRDVLNDINLEIPKNASIALVGATGAGKTTIVDTILGLLTPDAGSLLVDEQPITPARKRQWQRQIGYVPQEIYLIDNTIGRNIAFGVPDHELDRAAMERAARIAHIHDFIVNELPEGYETQVGERGVRLSGGQRQRLGIARALYHDPDVLVFDEATSDIDGVTEASITQAIDELAGQKTIILVAHRLATVRKCNRIHVLERGQVVEAGTFEELAATSKRFQELAQSLSEPGSGRQ